MKQSYNELRMQCMNMWDQINKTQPKNFDKITKTPKKFPKLKPGSQNAWNAWRKGEKEDLEHLPTDWDLD